ncbi:MAG: hypothetical protein QM667_04530 [Asticcacaulis sp.]
MYSWPNSPAYVVKSVSLWALFLAAIFAVTWGKYNGWPAPALWALALVPALTVIIQMGMVYRLISKQDEFIRALIAKRMLFAIGAVITLVVAYAPFQQLLSAPEIPAWLIYPLFWTLFGMSGMVINDGGRS